MRNDPTKPEFFSLWSLRELQIECARLNGVLKDCADSIHKADLILEDRGKCEFCGKQLKNDGSHDGLCEAVPL